MLRRSVRIFVLLLTIAVTAGVVWKATTNEQMRGRLAWRRNKRTPSRPTRSTLADHPQLAARLCRTRAGL